MPTCTIDEKNNLAWLDPAAAQPGASRAVPTSQQEFAQLAAGLPSAQLVAIWNRLPGVRPVRKFTDRKTAIVRLWRAIHSLPRGTQPLDHKPTRPPRGDPKSPPARSAPQRAGARSGTKTAQVLSLLRQANGATLAQLRKATGWQAHSVRGFISGTLRKKMGLGVQAFERADGQRAYRIGP